MRPLNALLLAASLLVLLCSCSPPPASELQASPEPSCEDTLPDVVQFLQDARAKWVARGGNEDVLARIDDTLADITAPGYCKNAPQPDVLREMLPG
ncbi:MAG: hypothetical protein AAF541_06685 [Pseudomonadota bacterium]